MTTSDSPGDDGAVASRGGADQFRRDLMSALRTRRERAGLSRAELGTLAGLGVSYVGMMEHTRINPRVSTVLKLVQIIDGRQGLNHEAIDALRDLVQFVEDLRGWIGSTADTLKRGWPVSVTSSIEAGNTSAAPARFRSDVSEAKDEGRSSMNQESGVTLAELLALADKKLGSRKETRAHLGGISTQRLYSATHGGPPLRAERVVRLAVIAGVEPSDALRASGHATLAALLEESYLSRLQDITIEDSRFLADLRRLSTSAQEMIRNLVSVLAAQQAGSPVAATSGRDASH